jgi:hypothetical protein
MEHSRLKFFASSVLAFFCLALPLRPIHAQAQPVDSIRIAVNAHAPGQPLVHFWSKVVGAGRANEALRATWHEELHTVAEALRQGAWITGKEFERVDSKGNLWVSRPLLP